MPDLALASSQCHSRISVAGLPAVVRRLPDEGGHAKRCPNHMIKSLLAFAASLLFIAVAHAQPTSGSPDPKTGVEMTGTIKEYTPGAALVLETLAPSEPVQFKLSKTVTYADKDGKPIEAAGLTTNQKVRVHYTKIAGDNVADKISLIGN